MQVEVRATAHRAVTDWRPAPLRRSALTARPTTNFAIDLLGTYRWRPSATGVSRRLSVTVATDERHQELAGHSDAAANGGEQSEKDHNFDDVHSF